MIIHCTQKLAAKLPSLIQASLTLTPTLSQRERGSEFVSWHAHLYTIDRRQCVLFCHDASRFMLFLPGVTKKHFTKLDKYHRELFLATLQIFGVKEVQLKKVELALGPAQYDTATNRSVLGSMKTARSDLEGWLYQVPNVMDLDEVEVSHDINLRPASISKEWIRPDKVMLEAITALY